MSSYDVVIPIYHPVKFEFVRQIQMLLGQSHLPGKIILMLTKEASGVDEKELYAWAREAEEDRGLSPETVPEVEVHSLLKTDFDHAGTRNAGASFAGAQTDFLLFLTQDARPLTENLAGKMKEVFEREPRVAVVYAKQVAGENAPEAEKISRAFNYADRPLLKGKEDEERLGIKTYFCSNACAMYRLSVFHHLNGFEAPAIFNEDMVYAHKAVQAGYWIAYEPEAKVEHSHRYTSEEQFRRNFDNGVSQAMHPEVFQGLSSEKEGKKLLKQTVHELAGAGKWQQIPPFFWQCVCRYAGFFLGRRYRLLPQFLVKRCAMNVAFFQKRHSQ